MKPAPHDHVEVALQARREGRRVILDNFHAQPGATPSVAGLNSTRASSANLAGRYSMTVFDADGKEHLNKGVGREDARKLVAAGAEFVGHAWRAP